MKPLPQRHSQILSLYDAGTLPRDLCATHPKGVVYAVLRKFRPDRTRAPRLRTSAIPAQALALAKAGMSAGRVASVLGISRAYAHRLCRSEID